MVLMPSAGEGSAAAAPVLPPIPTAGQSSEQAAEAAFEELDQKRMLAVSANTPEARPQFSHRESKAALAAGQRQDAGPQARRRLEAQARKRAQEEAEVQAQALHAQRDAQVQGTYAAAAKIQAGMRGAIARRATKDRMAKVRLSKEEKVTKMAENVFRTIRQHLKSDRKLYGKALADAAETFRVIDKDGSGTLSEAEFSEALGRMGFGLSQEQVEAVVRFADASGDGEIDYDEYISLIAREDPDLAKTEEAHVLEARRRDVREKRRAKRKAAAKKSAQMQKRSAYGQTIMSADERVAYLDARASRQEAHPATTAEGAQTSATEPLELSDQPVQFGEGNWVPHQHSFDDDTSGLVHSIDAGPEAPKEPSLPPSGLTGHRSWHDWYIANEAHVSEILEPSRKVVNTDTAEIKLLKDKFKALVYGRNKDPAVLLFRKFDPNGDGALDLQEFTEAVRRNWKGKRAPLTRKQILNLFNACDADGSGEIDMAELAVFVWGEHSPEATQARALMASGDWRSMSPRAHKSPDTPTVGVEYMTMEDVAPEDDGPAPTMQETMELRSKLKQASYSKGGQSPAELFRKFDTDGSGELDMSEFMIAIRKGGKMNKDQMSDRDIRRLFRLIDTDGGGEISIKELTAYVWGDQVIIDPDRDAQDSIPAESFATIRQAFFGTSQEQLNVARGDLVTIKDRKGVWCTVRDHGTGRVGLVPAAYINMPPAPGAKRPSQAAAVARLTGHTRKESDTGLLNHAGDRVTGKKEYWRTIAVPLEAHIAAARKGLVVPDVLNGAREFFSTHEDMKERLAKPAPARVKKLSQLATPKGGTAALERMRAEAQARQKELDSSRVSKSPKIPQPPSTRKPVLATPLSCRSKPSPRRRLRSLQGSQSARPAAEPRQRPQDFGVDTYVGQATVKSLRTQVIERRVAVPVESAAEARAVEALAWRLNERDVQLAQEAAERKQRLEEDQFAAQFDAQLAAAKRELHFMRLKEEQQNAKRSAHETKLVAQQEAAAKRRAKVQQREEQAEKERIEYNRIKTAKAKARAEEEHAQQMKQLEDRQLARDELNVHIAREQERRAAKHRGAFGAAPEVWRRLKKNEKAFRKIKGDAKRAVEQEQELSRKSGPIRQRKMAALHQEFNVVPTANGTYPRHTVPELAYALDTVAKGDLRMAVAYLTEEGAPIWAATKIQARTRGNKARTMLKRDHAAATVIQTRVRGIQGRLKGHEHMESVRSVRLIQARQRGILQRQRLLEQRAAAIRIQSAERGRAARAKKIRLRHNKHAAVLQQLCRRHFARQLLQKQTAAAGLIQRTFRGWRTRRIIASLKAETDKYTALKKVTAQSGADEKSKKMPSSEGSVFQPGERVFNTIGNRHVMMKGSNLRVKRIKIVLASGAEGWLSVTDKKGKALMVPIHRWIVRGEPTEAEREGKRYAMEGKLHWK